MSRADPGPLAAGRLADGRAGAGGAEPGDLAADHGDVGAVDPGRVDAGERNVGYGARGDVTAAARGRADAAPGHRSAGDLDTGELGWEQPGPARVGRPDPAEADTAEVDIVVATPVAASAVPVLPPRGEPPSRTPTAPQPYQPVDRPGVVGDVDAGWSDDYGEPRRRPRPRRGRWFRRTLIVLILIVLAAGGYYAFTLWQVWDTGRSDETRPVDAIVVMGAAQYDGRPSPQLAGRLDHVASLWPEGIAPIVVVTGGNQPGDRFTEAEASAAYLAERGVPSSVILSEDVGTTTLESLENVAELLGERGAGSVLIVTDPYHALRSRMIAEQLGLDAYVSPTDTSVVEAGASVRRHVQEAAGVSVGRLIGFDRLSGLID